MRTVSSPYNCPCASTIIMLVTAVVIGAFSAELYKMPTREFDIATAALTAVLFVGALAYVGAPELARAASALAMRTRSCDGIDCACSCASFFLGSQLLVDMRVARTGLMVAAATLSACVAGSLAWRLPACTGSDGAVRWR